MKVIKNIFCFILLTFSPEILSQDQSILIFDPNGVSTSFQYTLSQLTEDSVFVADSLDDSIYNYDAVFLFIDYANSLSQANVNRLINYTSTGKPTYIFSEPAMDSTSTPFWNHIGLYDMVWLLISSLIDSVEGIDTTFTEGIVIDTSFMSGGIPALVGTLSPILIGLSEGLDINPTYISTVDTLSVILDLYNLIDEEGFLRRVLEYFELISQQQNVEIQFFPPVDTALMQGGCTTPEFTCRNLISTNERDSISIEPGFNTSFYYLDSSGYQIPLDNYYFIIVDSLDEYEYELWYHPKSFPPFNPILIKFDALFLSEQNYFDIELIVKKSNIQIGSFIQPFHADFGLSVDEVGTTLSEFTLYQNHPNPFNPSTKIEFRIADFGFVSLKIYDILGNEVAILVNEEKQLGTYEVEFNSSSIKHHPSSGVYFYQLKAGNFVKTKKMVLIK